MIRGHLEMSSVNRAMKNLASAKKITRKEATEYAARGFIRKVQQIMPPGGNGKKGTAAKKAGEEAIKKDYARAFREMDEKFIDYLAIRGGMTAHGESSRAEELFKQRFRRYVSSRNETAIKQIFRDMKVHRTFVPAATKSLANSIKTWNIRRTPASKLFAVYPRGSANAMKLTQKRVGRTAGGWNAGAVRLKVSSPAWIKRHGTGDGSCDIEEKTTNSKITLTNRAIFAANQDSVIQAALGMQARSMEREANHLLTKAVRKAGFK